MAELDIVRAARKAARQIAEANMPDSGHNGWPLAIVELAKRLDREPEPERSWARTVIYLEVRGLLGDEPGTDYPHVPPKSWEWRIRQLIGSGRDHCPTCGRQVETEAELERFERLRVEEAMRRDARKAAR